MSNDDTRKEIKVLIAGAGIAGLSTAIALGRLATDTPGLHFDVQLYDKATELREIGASIALSPNGLRTLERLGVDDALADDVSYRGPAALPMIYHHWKTNEVVSADRFVDVPDRKHQTARFHRGHLHSTLLGHVPRETIHLRKAVESVVVRDDDAANGVGGGGGGGGGTVTLLFQDGTSATGDVLIGADGLRSKVRRTFVPGHTLHHTGRTWIRSTFDASLIRDIPNLPADSAHWWGPRYTFFASRLGRNMYTTVGNYDPEDLPGRRGHGEFRWDQEGDVNFFRDLYADWNPVVKALADATPHVRMYPNLAGEPLESWVFEKRVTLVGDAAHTHGGAHAAGGSLALDDAWALYLSLKHVLSSSTIDDDDDDESDKTFGSEEFERAFTLYENTRRPHTTRLVESVLATKAAAVVPSTDEELREKMNNRPNMTWLTEHDVEATFAKVLENEMGNNVVEDDDARQVERESVIFDIREATTIMGIPGSESVLDTTTESAVMVK
ncbi:uncharacterized protein PV06_05443 [Exophiala oligosperma]|uniref:FAD-binding domain-containing protein n=1 Tax=Exophiala oligosperma TaxID=215243 RepID=A0A0D2APE7_9EURO|nr:uncharacterized protein PV06_05443 [Exophiala oligosperma]KIW41836.1 hypothetical protein PV06_05443 [Exophiala oligosperma]